MCRSRTESKNHARNLLERFGLFVRKAVKHLRGMAAADSGAEMFEFALVVPLLLMLVLGIVWLGRAYNVYQTITHAARKGVRYAVLPSSVAAGNSYSDPLSGSCATGTNAYNNQIVPALKADSLSPTKVQNYCQKTTWLENAYPKQCGVVISFAYPLELEIPFTKLDATTLAIKTSAQMRLETQSSGGTCP